MRIHLCESLVSSRLNYFDFVFFGCILGKCRRLIRCIQKACTQFCFRVPPRSHITPYLIAANISIRLQLHLPVLLWKPRLPSKFIWCQKRFKHTGCSSYSPHNSFQRQFHVCIIQVLEWPTPPVRSISSKNAFKCKLKVFVLENQWKCCYINNISFNYINISMLQCLLKVF